MQNYLRQQTNSRTSYNMIVLVADMLKAYYYLDCTQQMYDNMIRCLDTLNELVQGPCLENQIAVAESKFFEIASELFTQRKDRDKTDKTGTMKTSATTMSQSSRKLGTGVTTMSASGPKAKSQDDLTDWMIARL